MTDLTNRKESRTANKGFASVGVTCLVNIDERVLCSCSSSVLFDSEASG